MSAYAWFTEPADRAAALIFGSIFGFFLLATVLYPLLRIREPDTVCLSRTTYNSHEIKGIYIPTSKVALSIYTFGSLALCVLTLLGSFSADTAEHRVKAFICTAFYGTVFVLTSISGLSRKRGIFITQEGVFWSGLIHACFVPWDQIAFIGLVQKKEQYTTSTELGLTVKDLDSIRTSKFTKNKLIENRKRYSWHLSYGRDLRAPLTWLSEKIQFYLQNPGNRLELENPETARVLLNSL
jgi:hypothetical protein